MKKKWKDISWYTSLVLFASLMPINGIMVAIITRSTTTQITTTTCIDTTVLRQSNDYLGKGEHYQFSGYVRFVEGDEQKRLKEVRVTIFWRDRLAPDERYTRITYTDGNGRYKFDDLPSRGKLGLNDFMIEVHLTDDKYLEIVDSPSNDIFSKRSSVFQVSKNNETMDILFDQGQESIAARIYYYTRATLDFFVGELGVRYSSSEHNQVNELDHNLPEKVYIFYQEMRILPKKRFLLRKFAGHAGWPDCSITITDGYCKTTTDPKLYMHEICHHVMFDLYEDFFVNNHTGCPGNNVNHGGDTNPCTCDGIIEGWAEFIPCMITDDPMWPVENAKENIELNWNHAVDNPEFSPITCERAHLGQEFAIAGILWDLYDNNTQRENADLNRDGHFEGNEVGWLTDNIHLSRNQIWNVLNNADIHTIRDLYTAFRRSSYINNIDDLKNIFIAHGWDPGAEGW